jgi:selenocysteine lyase/cysteine desulfurase
MKIHRKLIINKVDIINFYNAATTPLLREVMKAVKELAPCYSSVHRGNGKYSRISSELYEALRYERMDFFGASAEHDTIIYLKNTTEAVNKLFSDLCFPGVGIISFNLKNIYHEELTAALSDKAGIAVRNWCFCAQPYVQRLLGLSKEEINMYKNNLSAERGRLVCVSFGFDNCKKKIELFADFLQNY